MNVYRPSFYTIILAINSLSLMAMEQPSFYTPQDAAEIINFSSRGLTKQQIEHFLCSKALKLNNAITIAFDPKIVVEKPQSQRLILAELRMTLELKRNILLKLLASIHLNKNVRLADFISAQMAYEPLHENFSHSLKKLREAEKKPIESEVQPLIFTFESFTPPANLS